MVGRSLRWALRICAVATLLATALFMICAVAAHEVTPVPPTMDVLLLAAIGGAAATVVLSTLLLRRWAALLLLLLLPPLIVPLGYGAIMIPASDAAHVRLADGRVLHLSVGPTLTDVTYDLWQETQGGLLWRRIPADLNYSEDGRFTGDERLVLSRDGRRLLVGRGGIWTDCLEGVDFRPCPLGLADTNWSDPDFETRMRANSAVIGTALP